MSESQQHKHILAFKYDQQVEEISLLLDKRFFFLRGASRIDLESFLTSPSRSLFHAFTRQIVESGFAFCNRIILTKENEEEYSFSLFGVLKNAHIYVLAARDQQHLFAESEEFAAIVGKQGELYHEGQKDVAFKNEKSTRRDSEKILYDYMILNNKLANMQRELTLKNLQITSQQKCFKDLFALYPNPLVVLSPSGSLLFMNPAAEHYSLYQDGHNFELFKHFDDKKIQELQLEVDGQDVFVEVRSTDIEWQGNPARLVSFQDITQRKEFERLKEDVERITRHDLKAPLSGMISVYNCLLQDDNLDQEQRKMLRMGRQRGYDMLGMINRSLDLYKMEMGSYLFEPKPVDLAVVLQSLIETSTSIAKRHGISLSASMNGIDIASLQSGQCIMAERMLLHTALGNLLQNALEASPVGGSVKIEVATNEACHIRISNQGRVPEQIKDSFFEKYTTWGKKSGTGLGAYSAKLIIETMGGTISMVSDASSTEITIQLPLAEQGDLP